MSFLLGSANSATDTYEISNSLRFATNTDLKRLPAATGQSIKGTLSVWVKFGTPDTAVALIGGFDNSGAKDNDGYFVFQRTADGNLQFEGGDNVYLETSALFRDVTAWYHIVLAIDSGNSTAAQKQRIYVNGAEITAFDTRNNLTNLQDLPMNTTAGNDDALLIGCDEDPDGKGLFFEGYMSEFYWIDQNQYAASDFGEYNDDGVWIPKEFEGSFGVNGVFLQFKETGTSANSSGIGADTGGSNLHFSVTNLVATDVTTDTPTNNFATLNPFGMRYTYNSDPPTNAARLSQGNLVTLTRTSSTGDGNSSSTIALPNSGKFYAEFKIADANGGGIIGIRNVLNAKGVQYIAANGKKSVDGTASSYGNAYGNGHIVGMAIDIDNSKIYFSKDGTFQNSGDPTSGSTGTGAIGYDVAGLIDSDGGDYFIIIGDGGGSIGPVVQSNFGNPSFAVSSGNTDGNGIGNFEFAPPSGYLSFCTKNLASSFTTINDSSKYFQTTLYTGNGSADHAITNDGNSDLQPDWVWIKNRDEADSHCLFDSVRGVTKLWSSDDPAVQSTDGDTLDAFQSDGFRVDADVKVNTNNEKYVAWQWLCNGGTNETAVNESGNNPGNTRQTNTDAGFSIITYVGTGAAGTIAHGLGVRPDWIIVKGMDVATDSMVYHEYNTAAPETDALTLTEAAGTSDNAGWWNDTAPTSSVFTLGDHDRVNKNGNIYIAYCFAAKQGYSKFGNYKGNGIANGVFVYLGFKPAFVIVKSSTKASQSWHHLTGEISTGTNLNPVTDVVDANQNIAERGTFTTDFLSNGFKIRHTSGGTGTVNETYVYMAFAENPFVSSKGIPTTAR